MMRSWILISAMLLAGCTPTKIIRYTMNPWENDIGYAEVVQAGNTYYVSGVVCSGATYEKAVGDCYHELGEILHKIHLSPKNIVKENVYARDIEEFKKNIELRKQFYTGGDYPAATWLQVDRYYLPEHLVEIELVVVR